jgi:hypothetical protein
MKTYLCLKTISFVHIINFDRCYLLLVLLEVTLIKSFLWDAQKNETTILLRRIVSLTSDPSVVMSSPLGSARDFEFLEQGTLFN